MKTEEILLRKVEEKNRIAVLNEHWPWLVPDQRADVRIVTLFKGVITEDGTVIPEDGYVNPLEDISD